MSRTSQTLRRLGVPGLAAVTLVAGIPAFLGTAQAAPISSLSITPVDGNTSAAAGACQAFVVTGVNSSGASTVGESVNIILTDVALAAGAASTADVSFCTAPTTVGTTTSTPAQGTVLSAGGAQAGGGSVDQSRFTLGAGTTALPNQGRVIIGLTRNQPTPAGSTVTVRAYSDQNSDGTFNAGEPTATTSATFTAGGPAGSNANANAVNRVEVIDGDESATATADVDSDTALAGETRSFSVGALNESNDKVAGVTVSYFTTTTNTAGQSTTSGVSALGVTNNDGIATGSIAFPTQGNATVTFFVNQTTGATGGLDAGEPRDTVAVAVASNAGQQNRSVTLTAQADNASALNATSGGNAVNFVGDTNRVFRAVVDDPRSAGEAASATTGTFVSFAVTGGSGDETVTVTGAGQQTTNGFTNECTAVDNGATADTNDSVCEVTVNDPTPVTGQTLTVTATVRGTTATSAATLRFRGQPTDARFIAVTPDGAETLTESVRRFTALVTDANGRPVEGVVVDFTETGSGFFRSTDANGVVTDVNGQANIETTSARNETGEQVVTGTIRNSQQSGNGGTSTPQCGQAAGQGTNPTPNANGTNSPVVSTTAAGNCADTGRTTFVNTLTASPSASASPSATSTVSPSPTQQRLGIAVSPSTITPGVQSVVTVTGAPGTTVELRAYSRPSTTYVVVRRGVIGQTGRIEFRVVPGTNTRLFAAVTGQTGTESPSVVINVRTALSLTVVRNGSRDYTFQGRILPRRAGQLITLYRVTADGREIITSQVRTDSTGTYRIRRVFTGSGTFGFLTRTSQTLTNAAGVSNNGQARATSIYAGPQR